MTKDMSKRPRRSDFHPLEGDFAFNAALIAWQDGEIEGLRTALKALSDMYVHAWDLSDGGLIMLDGSIARFEEAHRNARIALGKPLLGDLPGNFPEKDCAVEPDSHEPP